MFYLPIFNKPRFSEAKSGLILCYTKESMNKTKTLLIILGVILLGIAAAGMYKFNYLANQPGYDVDGNKIETENVSEKTDATQTSETETTLTIEKSEDFVDARDRKVYPTVKIGDQIWMTKNLAFKTPKSFAYKDDEKNTEKYGRLYLFEDLKNAVPIGWHVATDEEWKTLEKNLGMKEADVEISDYMTKRGTTEGGDIKAGGKTMLDFPMAGFRRDDGKYEGGDDDKERPRTYIWVDTKVQGQEGEEVFRRRVEKDSTNLYRFTNPAGGFAITARLVKDTEKNNNQTPKTKSKSSSVNTEGQKKDTNTYGKTRSNRQIIAVPTGSDVNIEKPSNTKEVTTKKEKEKIMLKSRSVKTVSSSLSDISNTIPSNLDGVYKKNFNKYTAVVAPNGKAIHIVAQNKISNEQILRARNILMHYLNNFPGSKYGSNKSTVANQMANKGAILALLNGQDDGSNPVGDKVTGQPLYQNEIQTEGGDWYMKQNYEHRDAAYEEILHFVHDNGIGVDGPGGNPGALPTYQAEIRKAQKNALANNLWGRGVENKSWIAELTQENSLSQEYLASVIDSYYGLWGAWSEGKGGMWDIYIAKTRNDVKTKDSMGYTLAKDYFQSFVTYNARIEPSFSGTFSLKFDASKPYTHHSQYLRDITLLGKNNNNVVVNAMDNYITGNVGTNTVIFSGKSTEYKIVTENGKTIVQDTVKNRDGENVLTNIEKLKFSDKEVGI